MNLQLKRFLCILLAAVLVLSMFPVSALAETAETTYPVTGSCGESLTWSLDESGTLTVSGTGEMADYTADGGQPWAGYSAQINSLIIENGVTKLGAFAFDGLSALAAVVFKGSAPQIGQYCFFGATVTAAYTCDASWTSDVLKNYGGTITWSATHTGEEITDPAVEPTCTKTGLTEGKHCSVCGIILKAQTTVPAMGHNYGEWIVTKEATCTTDGEENRTCATCGEVETHTIAAAHSWDDGVITTQPTNTSTGVKLYTCTICSETKEETLPATSLSYGKCGDNLTYVLETNGTLTISGAGNMKNYSDSIAYGPKWYRFADSIKTAVIEEGVTSIGNYAFYNCANLTKAYIADSVTGIGKFTFYSCAKLTSINIPDDVTSIGNYAFYGCSSLTSINIPDGVRYICDNAFYDCKSLTSVTIGNGVGYISRYAFHGCSSLTSINIPDNVTGISNYAFYGCSSLTSINIPDSVTSIGYSAFRDCPSLTSINIPDSVTFIGESAFNICSKLANVHYSGDSDSWDKITISSGNTCLTNAFIHYNSTGTKIAWTYEDGVLTIGGSGEMDEYKGFPNSRPWLKYVNDITSVVIEDGVTAIGSSAFEGMSALTEITFKGSAPKFGENCFKGTTAVAKYTCDETWTSDVLQNYGGTITWNATHTGEELVDKEAVAPTCTKSGLTESKKCSVCGVTISEQKVVDALGHTEVIDKAVVPTCTKTGLTEGKHCSVCNAVLVEQKVVDALGHTEVIDEAVEPTCTETGLTEGKHCSVCNAVLVEQKIVDVLGHTEVIDKAVVPTCTKTGLTEGKHCSVCNTVLVEQKIVDALGHTEVIDAAVAPTCTKTGLTEGKHCSVCNAVLVEQKVVDALGHTEVIDKAVAPTCTKTGLTEGKHCSVCNAVLVEQKVVEALGHTIVVDKAVNPTYDKTGLTEGSHCSVCNEVITKQKVVPMKLVAAPKKVKAQSAGYASVRISWGKVSYATGYAVYRATSKNGTYKYIGKTSKNYYTDAKRTTGTTYYYKIRAYRTVNKANKYGAYSAIVYAKALPATPVLTAKNAGTRKIKLSWKKISGVHGYEIYRATSKNGKYALAKRVTSGSTLSFTNTGLTKGKTYYYKVRAYRTVKGSRKYGAFSTVKYAKG